MKKILLITILCCFFLGLPAQENSPITVEKKGMRKTYVQNDHSLTYKELSAVLKSGSASEKAFRSSTNSKIAGMSMILVGTLSAGVGLAYSVKSAEAVNEGDLVGSSEYSNWSAAYSLVGAGFFLLSVPFYLRSGSQLTKSIRLYNSGSLSGNTGKVYLYLSCTPGGIGLNCRF